LAIAKTNHRYWLDCFANSKLRLTLSLANSSTYRTPYEAYPALNSFDHAIVMAICDGQEVWIDCTFPGSSAHRLSRFIYKEKMVLIASADTQSLSRIPACRKNRTDMWKNECCVFLTTTLHSLEVTTRSLLASLPPSSERSIEF
jgi:hypothetical protein